MLWIPAYNKVLAVARDACAESTEKRRVDLREPEAWLHLAVHLAKHARVTAPDYALTAAVFDEAKDAIGKGRCRAINAASDFSEDDILGLYNYFNELAPRRVSMCTVATIDETILAYYGRDGKLKAIWRRIPEKPHSKGLIQYRAVTYFKHSMRRAIICTNPFLPGRKLTPSDAAIEITQTLVTRWGGAWHLFLDSGFATQEVFAALPNFNVANTICVRASSQATLVRLWPQHRQACPSGAYAHSNTTIRLSNRSLNRRTLITAQPTPPLWSLLATAQLMATACSSLRALAPMQGPSTHTRTTISDHSASWPSYPWHGASAT